MASRPVTSQVKSAGDSPVLAFAAGRPARPPNEMPRRPSRGRVAAPRCPAHRRTQRRTRRSCSGSLRGRRRSAGTGRPATGKWRRCQRRPARELPSQGPVWRGMAPPTVLLQTMCSGSKNSEESGPAHHSVGLLTPPCVDLGWGGVLDAAAVSWAAVPSGEVSLKSPCVSL